MALLEPWKKYFEVQYLVLVINCCDSKNRPLFRSTMYTLEVFICSLKIVVSDTVREW